ncbi:MAG: protease modulator HflC [Solobacterium sp.]|nr:protease modulator HflC [Solobacterium sp.]
MKNLKKVFVTIAIILIAIVGLNGAYSLGVNQYAVIRQFGRIVKIESEPGLKFKIPFIQNVQKISSAITLYDIAQSDVITKDKKSMIADDYVLWRVKDPTKYVQTLNAVVPRAQERIEAASYNATKTIISSMTQDEVIEARGERLTKMLTEEANNGMESYGIEIVEVQIKALDLPEDNKQAVYARMISERENIAASYTAAGKAEAQKIRNETDKQVTILKSAAEKQAAVLEAEGEEQYMKTLQDAYNTQEKADFYQYIRSLDALKKSMQGGEKTIILDKDSELVKILYGTN